MTGALLLSFALLGQYSETTDPVLVELRQLRVEIQQYHTEVTKIRAILVELREDVNAHQVTLHGRPGEEGRSGILSKQTKLEASWTRHSRFFWGALAVLGTIAGGVGTASAIKRLGLRNGNGSARKRK